MEGGQGPRISGEGQWTRRELMQGLAMGAAATAFSGVSVDAQAQVSSRSRRGLTTSRRSRRAGRS